LTKNEDVLRCSFCSKSQNDVKKLIAGPAVYICDQCVESCNQILAAENQRRPAGRLGPFFAKLQEKIRRMFTASIVADAGRRTDA